MAQKITFTLAPEIVANATEGILLGDFNNWQETAGIKLKKQKDGSLKAIVSLEPGTYQYRYFLNDGRWVNDSNAGGYNFVGEFGVDNCVISIPAEAVKETVAKADIVAKPKKAEAPKAVAPKVEAKKAEAPKKVAAPKVAAPKVAAPKAAAPKAPAKAAKKPAAKVEAPVKKITKKAK